MIRNSVFVSLVNSRWETIQMRTSTIHSSINLIASLWELEESSSKEKYSCKSSAYACASGRCLAITLNSLEAYRRTTNSVRLILGSQYSISANPTLSHVQLCENHIKRARLLWGLKQVLGSNVIPLRTPENQIWHTDDSCLSQKNKAIFFISRSSSAIADMTQVTQVLAIRASCFYISRPKLGQAN